MDIIDANTILYRKAFIRSWWVFIVEIHDVGVVHFTNKFNTHFDRLCAAQISYIPLEYSVSIMVRYQKYWSCINFSWIFDFEYFFLCGKINFNCCYTVVMIKTFLWVFEFWVLFGDGFDQTEIQFANRK